MYTYTQVGAYTVTQWVTDTTTGETDALTRTAYIAVTRPVTTVISYDYDPLYRLVSATLRVPSGQAYSTGEVYTYTYDQVGNRLAMGALGQVITFTYDMANRLTSVGGVGYDWDDNGNLLADGVRSYEYDYANRLVQVVSGTLTTAFTYNGDGHRVAQATNGVTTTYVVAVLGLSQVLVETTGGDTTRYVFGHDGSASLTTGLLAEYDGVAWAYHLDDGLGSVRQLADEDGQVTLAQSYAPFGEPLWSQGSGTTSSGFTGERGEAYSQLLFLRARYYEPRTGRFLSSDAWPGAPQQPQSLNHYVYVVNGPTNRFDPTGYFSDRIIYNSLEGRSLDDAFGAQSGFGWNGLDRWGLLALLRDAKDGDQILARYADFSYQGDHYPLAPDPAGAWCVKCDETLQQLTFSNSRLGADNLPLISFLASLNLHADEMVWGSDKWWRPRTLQLHWYQRDNTWYSDWDSTDLPDLFLIGATFNFGIGVQVAFISDRYGNQYMSIGGGLGYGVDLGGTWEGYASERGPFYSGRNSEPVWREYLSETALKNMIVGAGFTFSIAIPGAGSSIYTGPTESSGLVLLFGGLNFAVGIGGSLSWTWQTGTDLKKRWNWVDTEIPTYDASIKNLFDPESAAPSCGCE